jgi:hypothetical protein
MSPHAPTPGRKRSGTGRAGPALEALLDGGTQPLTETDKTDEKDAVVIAGWPAQLRCYVREPVETSPAPCR